MFHYPFPQINTIEDVLWAVQDSPEFVVADKGEYKVINYLVNGPETFPDVKTAGGTKKDREHKILKKSLRRECRGIVFDKHGKLIARRLHKFFNVNERDETLAHKIDFEMPHVILEKLDGSMITPICFSNGQFVWGTKMGETDVANNAANHVHERNQGDWRYSDLAWELQKQNATPIFEWCSRKNRIVIDYPKDKLVLTAVRFNDSGYYWSYDSIVGIASHYQIPVVKAYPGTVASLEKLLEETKDLKGQEGWVIRFDDGHMLKIKGEDYCRIHQAKELLAYEKYVLEAIINEKVDDIKPFLMDEDRIRVEEYQKKVLQGIESKSGELLSVFIHLWKRTKGDRKTFALQFAPALGCTDRSIIYALWDKGWDISESDIRNHVLQYIGRNVSTQTKVDGARFIWGGHRWDEQKVEE